MIGNPLAGKTALVTGGARRIGRSIALALAEAGADVVITYRSRKHDAEETAVALQACGSRASIARCDLDEPASIQPAVAGILERYGQLDLLVNSAGHFESVALEALTITQWDTMFSANLRGPFFMAQACYPSLKQAGGRIVNVGSLGGIEPWATHGHYCASKAGLHMLTKTMAKAWAPEVSVNCVAPGMIDQGEGGLDRFAEKTPLQRNGKAEDVAAAVLYFASAAGFVTGQVLTVDGGLGL